MSQKIINDIKLGFKDVLIKPKRSSLSSRSQVELNRTFKFKNSPLQWTGVPVVAANMDTIGTFDVAKVLTKHNMLTAIHKHYSLQEWDDFFSSLSKKEKSKMCNHIMASAGTSDNDFEKLKIIMSKFDIKFICLDIANGYSEHFSKFVAKVRKEFPEKIIFAGNVVTEDMTHQLLLDGADVIKIGIGPGSVCTTRKQTGVGYPQLSAVLECSDAAHGLNGAICSDGGCTCPGDASKAFGADADFVMIGGMFAGHDQSGGNVVQKNDEQFVEYYGMSSKTAMDKHSGGVSEYRSSEGKKVLVPYKGDIEHTVLDLLGGIRSTCTYVGASKIKELGKCTTFIRVQEQLNEIFGKA